MARGLDPDKRPCLFGMFFGKTELGQNRLFCAVPWYALSVELNKRKFSLTGVFFVYIFAGNAWLT